MQAHASYKLSKARFGSAGQGDVLFLIRFVVGRWEAFRDSHSYPW